MDTNVTFTFDLLNTGSGRKTGEVTALINKQYVAHCVKQVREQNENKICWESSREISDCLPFWSSEMLPRAVGNVTWPDVWKERGAFSFKQR